MYLNEFKYPVRKSEYVFSSFRRLAIIYENQKDYQSALEVCNQAIAYGYIEENGDTDMYYRRSRLLRKLGIDEAEVIRDPFEEESTE